MISDVSPTVLVVEDHAELRFILEQSLHILGEFNVITAEDGVAGLEQLALARPACIVVDAMMPRLNGFQFIAAVRGDPQTADLPIIMLTALAQDKDRFAGAVAGADLYILKPAMPQDIVAAVRSIITMTPEVREQRLRQLAELPGN